MTSSSVCGVNGETFSSECHAHDSHILIDYYDRCHSTPSPGTVSQILDDLIITIINR